MLISHKLILYIEWNFNAARLNKALLRSYKIKNLIEFGIKNSEKCLIT